MRIEEYHKTELEPVEITEGYYAGWLSPDGEFYGLNGSTGNLLTSTSPNGCSRPKRFQSKRCGIRIAGWKRTAG